MSFKVETTLDTGHVTNGYQTFKFNTEAEAKAFARGVDVASEATNGWLEGWLSAEVSEA